MPSEVVEKITPFGYTYIHVASSGRYRKHDLGGPTTYMNIQMHLVGP